MKILEADVWTDDKDSAELSKGEPLSSDHQDLVCVSVHREQESHIVQPMPEPRPDPSNPGRTIQDPAPEPLPGKVRYRLHYESK